MAWLRLNEWSYCFADPYHAFKFRKYAHRYLAECQYRFNRRFDMKAMLRRLLRAAAITGPRTESWLRLAEVGH